MISEWSMWTSLGNPGLTSFRGLLLARQAEGRLTVFTDVFLKSERQDGSWSEWAKITHNRGRTTVYRDPFALFPPKLPSNRMKPWS
jgi:hypothetical protein